MYLGFIGTAHFEEHLRPRCTQYTQAMYWHLEMHVFVLLTLCACIAFLSLCLYSRATSPRCTIIRGSRSRSAATYVLVAAPTAVRGGSLPSTAWSAAHPFPSMHPSTLSGHTRPTLSDLATSRATVAAFPKGHSALTSVLVPAVDSQLLMHTLAGTRPHVSLLKKLSLRNNKLMAHMS